MINEPCRMSGHGCEEVGWEEIMQRKMTSFCLEQGSHEGSYAPGWEVTPTGSFL